MTKGIPGYLVLQKEHVHQVFNGQEHRQNVIYVSIKLIKFVFSKNFDHNVGCQSSAGVRQ